MDMEGMEGPPGNQSPAEKCEQPVAKLELRSEMGAVRHCDLRHLKLAQPNEICMTHCR